jgi:hypothetical protein
MMKKTGEIALLVAALAVAAAGCGRQGSNWVAPPTPTPDTQGGDDAETTGGDAADSGLPTPTPDPGLPTPDSQGGSAAETTGGSAADSGLPPPDDNGAPPPLQLIAVTFNTGTSTTLPHNAEPDDGYTSEHAELTDLYYGNGLSWLPLIDDVRAFFKEVKPDIVAFQEIFWPGECPEIPEEARKGFICESWAEGDPTVIEDVLGVGWQVACHPGKPDKCLAVHERLGRIRGCEERLCLDGLDGFRTAECGKGARIARGVIELEAGGTLTVVSFHGSSGISSDDIQCRVKQVEQAFVDLGDGEPGANGERNIVLGDFNTDPGRMAKSDDSAARLLDFAGEGGPFHFVSEMGPSVTPTYARLFNIDHVIADVLDGECWAAGITPGHEHLTETVFFDHRPVVCSLTELRR